MNTERFASIWDAIEDMPENATNVKIRAALMPAIERRIKAGGWSQTESAKRLGVTHPHVLDVMRGKIDLFSIDALVNMGASTFLAAAIVLPTMANAQAAPEHHVWQDKRIFEPMSRTAQSITGSIRLSGNPYFADPGSKMRMTFENGASVSLTAVEASWRHWDDASDHKVTAEVFQIDHDPGPLENGNTLCGDPEKEPARYVVFHEGYLIGDTQLLGLAVFGSKKPPHDINSPGLCGTFNFYVD